MRSRYQWSLQAAPKTRVVEERHNVEITDGYIVAVKPNESDRDFHVIVSSSAKKSAVTAFINVEVSGLPLSGVDKDQFVQVRYQIRSILPDGSDQGTSYIILKQSIHVAIKGSVYFDGDHQAGCQHCPGRGVAKPSTVWEIHPVYSITAPTAVGTR